MKNFTKKFLKTKLKSSELTIENIDWNAKRSKEKLEIPVKLYKELSKVFPHSLLIEYLKEGNHTTTFMAGFITGWAEKNKNIK